MNCTGFHPSTSTSPVLSGSFECDKFEEAFGAVLTKEQIDTAIYTNNRGIVSGMASFVSMVSSSICQVEPLEEPLSSC